MCLRISDRGQDRVLEKYTGGKDVRSVVVPEGVTVIGRDSFRGNRGIVSVELPNSLRAIESSAFCRCDSLAEINLPARLEEIGDWAFAHTKLTRLTIPDSVTRIGEYAFRRCGVLSEISLPVRMSVLESGVFMGCTMLSDVSLPNGLMKIGNDAFHSCEALSKINLPETLTEIGHSAFFGCRTLKKLVIPAQLTNFGDNAFLHCALLTPESANGMQNPALSEQLRCLKEQEKCVVLSCDVCGSVHDKPLSLKEEGSFPGAQIAAYACVEWDEELLLPGEVSTLRVTSPFCCALGEHFSAQRPGGGYVTAKLTEIVSMDDSSAVLRAEVLRVGDARSFVRRLSMQELLELYRGGTYDYDPPDGDAPNPQYSCEKDGLISLYNSFGGGDVETTHYLYTDEDGVDHLVETMYRDFEKDHLFIGDKVLGMHRNCPVQWKNGLLIDRRLNMVVSCSKDLTDAVVPDGVRIIGWFSFCNQKNLRSVSIPASVDSCYHSFGFCPNLQKFTLAAGINNNVVTEIKRAIPTAEIVFV